MKRLLTISLILLGFCGVALGDHVTETLRRDMKRDAASFRVYTSSAQVRINERLLITSFKGYTTTRRVTVNAFGSYTSSNIINLAGKVPFGAFNNFTSQNLTARALKLDKTTFQDYTSVARIPAVRGSSAVFYTYTGWKSIGAVHEFGDGTNKTVIESDGTLRFDGASTVTNDIQFNMDPQATGLGHPTLAAWNTDFEEWRYGINDHANAESQEVPHWWKEGSAVSCHVHWSTGSGNYVAGDKVQWQLHIAAADSNKSSPFAVFPAATVLTVEQAFSDTVLPYSGVLSIFSDYTLPATWTKIGAQVKVKLTRIAKTAGGSDPGTDPFVLQTGCHLTQDTIGSRTNTK